MKVAILGASGIIGQHMRLCIPECIEPVWVRSEADLLHKGVNLTDSKARLEFLNSEQPDAIVNLAGESRPDVVQFTPELSHEINVVLPSILSDWCNKNDAHYIHVSTQAVYQGDKPPYSAGSPQGLPVNEYGIQKQIAEQGIKDFTCWTIVRPTFVLGVRPLPFVGRENPVEQILSGKYPYQVDDRFFSVSFAEDVAKKIWEISQLPPFGRAINVGTPEKVSRYLLSQILECKTEPVSHDYFKNIAPRPLDTTYTQTDELQQNVRDGLYLHRIEFNDRQVVGISSRTNEISLFTGTSKDKVFDKLSKGFGPLHNEVSDDFRKSNPKTEEELLNWYKTTESYIWELSAYHLDTGFNYSGMCQGVGDRLIADGAKRILCLGDGIGDLTLSLHKRGLQAMYHDLGDSRTFKFAKLRYWMYTGESMPYQVTYTWQPVEKEIFENIEPFDAIVSFDFLEHVPNVLEWVESVKSGLKPNGLFFAQNAFNCGSGENGAIPMHLAINDRFEKDWDPMLFKMGFTQLSSNWYQKGV